MKKELIISLGLLSFSTALTYLAVRYYPLFRNVDPTRAALTSTLTLPPTVNVNSQQQFTIPVSLDTGGNQVIGYDLQLQYDPQKITLIDILTNNATTFKVILPMLGGNFDKSGVIQQAESSGILKMSGIASEADGSKRVGFTGQLPSSNSLLTLIYRAANVSTTQSAALNIVHTLGSTTDTNIASANENIDTLLSVQNAVITINPLSVPSTLPSTNPTLSPSPVTQPSPSLISQSPSIRPSPTVVSPSTLISPSPSPTNIESPLPPANVGSQITVFATGSIAGGIYPQMRVWVDGSAVSADIDVNKSTSPDTFMPYIVPIQSLNPRKVRVYFVNDAVVRTPSYQDRNLRVQKIALKNRDYPTTSVDVYSVGVCNNTGCGAGFKRSEWLAAGWWRKEPPLWHMGYFEFSI